MISIKAKFFLALFLFWISCSYGQTINISDCTFLQNNIALNNLTVSYQLALDIDCSTVNPFIPIGNSTFKFQGKLDGKGFTISNLNISSVSNLVASKGIFAYAQNSTFANLSIQNFNLISSSTNNSVNGTGCLVGYCTSCELSKIQIKNSVVFVQGINVGGVVGHLEYSKMSFCAATNVNITSDENVGGLAGQTYQSTLSESGFVKGSILVRSKYLGGIVGYSSLSNYDQVYSRPEVTLSGVVETPTSFCGGLFGYFFSVRNSVTNSYSRVKNLSCCSNVGGLTGYILYFPTTYFGFSNCYASINVSGTSDTGALFGSIQGPTPITQTLFFDDTIFPNSTAGKGMNCVDLFLNVSSSFPQGDVWGNDRLKIEIDYSLGVCNCALGCPTTPPSTITPSTLIPSTNPPTHSPSTLTPSTTIPTSPSVPSNSPTSGGVTNSPSILAPTTIATSINTPAPPSTVSPSTITPLKMDGTYQVFGNNCTNPKCCCITSNFEIETSNSLLNIEISSTSGNCSVSGKQKVSFTFITPAFGNGVFNGVPYTFSKVGRQLTLLSFYPNCSMLANCISGLCSSSNIVSFSLWILSFTLFFFV